MLVKIPVQLRRTVYPEGAQSVNILLSFGVVSVGLCGIERREKGMCGPLCITPNTGGEGIYGHHI